MLGSFRLAQWQEGPVGSGQGGLASYYLCRDAGAELSVRLHAPIPLETDLVIGQDDDQRYTVTADDKHKTLILSGRPAEFISHPTSPVSVDEAKQARLRTELHAGIHGAPNCFSCGFNDRSMGVHPGPLGDGRFATDVTPPSWVHDSNGFIEPYAFWAALDCTAGVYVASGPEERVVVTANYQVRMHRDHIEPGSFAVVGYAVDDEWDGRKRWAASAAFDAHGDLVAEATSLWVSIPGP